MKCSIKPVRKYGMEQYEAELTNNDRSWRKSGTFFSEAGARTWLIRELYRLEIAEADAEGAQ